MDSRILLPGLVETQMASRTCLRELPAGPEPVRTPAHLFHFQSRVERVAPWTSGEEIQENDHCRAKGQAHPQHPAKCLIFGHIGVPRMPCEKYRKAHRHGPESYAVCY